MLSSREIRQQFIDYFVKKAGHTFVPSSPVVPHDDPTLLFTNAGMNQFKELFLGTGTREYHRAANTQKCIRAGGKHNDLEDVGKDTYHHTFFEMLGNWSFGDYFKKEAIDWAWDLLVNVWGLDPNRLHATYFQGDPNENLAPDEEARQLWLQYLPAERIHPGNKKDNFWEMGDTGPCGPCSEIHIDRTPDQTGGPMVNGGDARVMEIWNLVFIQFNRDSSGKLTTLPNKHVDTGMGFERLCAVIASKDRNYDAAVGNYDTDVFTPLFTAIQQVTGARAYTAKLEDHIDVAYRVIADHLRCLTFALTDGATPGNEGRGYVLRRILRRAVRHGRQTLGVAEPFLHKLVPAVVSAMGDAFPELKKNPQHVIDLIHEEEQSFGRTLDRGIALFEQAASRAAGKQVTGADAFMLHDTYGFPLDLTQVMAEERGLSVDVPGFNQLMEEAREKARAAGTHKVSGQALLDLVQKENPPATEFTGYTATELQTTSFVKLYAVREDGYDVLPQVTAGQEATLVTGQTPFYAESGGQVGDTGIITVGSATFEVQDTQKVGSVFLHIGVVKAGTITAGDNQTLQLAVSTDRRARIMANHTTTHVMNRALRKFVNPEADQKGSLVDDQKLRFDFSHNSAVTPEQIEQVEQRVNGDIVADLPVYFEYAPVEQGRAISGLRAVFGEKYPPKVRIVSIGVPVTQLLAEPGNERWADFSIEFCGGTHLKSTGDAEGFVVVGEEAVAKGIRRLTALTGAAAHQAAAHGERLLARVTALKQAEDEQLAAGITKVSAEVNEAQLPLLMKSQIRAELTELQKIVKERDKARSQAALGDVVSTAQRIAEAGDEQLIIARVDGTDTKTLRNALEVIRKTRPAAAVLLGSAEGDKVALVAAVPEARIKQGMKAGDWVKQAALVVGGSGGGRPDIAQAGGKDPAKLDAALEAGRQFARTFVQS